MFEMLIVMMTLTGVDLLYRVTAGVSCHCVTAEGSGYLGMRLAPVRSEKV